MTTTATQQTDPQDGPLDVLPSSWHRLCAGCLVIALRGNEAGLAIPRVVSMCISSAPLIVVMIYAVSTFDVGHDGPVVLEIPEGPAVGMVDGYWQWSFTNVGMAGPDKGQGGKFLIG